MPKTDRHLKVLTDGTPFTEGSRFHLYGKVSIGLYPDLFLLECWNLSGSDVFRLQNTKELSVMRDDSCLAFGQVSDVFCRTVPEGTVTTAAFSLGLDLWESQVSLAVPAGTSVSETVRRVLSASGTGIQLLSFPGDDPVFNRGLAFCGRAADCITEALSRVVGTGNTELPSRVSNTGNTEALSQVSSNEGRNAAHARCYLVPAGLCIIPADPLTPTLHLSESDLTDHPAIVDRGRKMILSTTVTGFQPGEEMTLQYKGTTSTGLILERMTDADTGKGQWRTELLIERR